MAMAAKKTDLRVKNGIYFRIFGIERVNNLAKVIS